MSSSRVLMRPKKAKAPPVIEGTAVEVAPPAKSAVSAEIDERLAAGEDMATILADLQAREPAPPPPPASPNALIAIHYVTKDGHAGYDNVTVSGMKIPLDPNQCEGIRQTLITERNYARVTILNVFALEA